MSWWQWIVLGTILLGAEMLAVDAEFYLVFLGLSAIVVGLLGLSPLELPIWAQWLTFAGVAAASIVLFRSKLYMSLRGHIKDLDEGAVGEHAVADAEIAPGEIGQVRLRGTPWKAKNIGEVPVAAGARAEVVRSSALTLEIRAES